MKTRQKHVQSKVLQTRSKPVLVYMLLCTLQVYLAKEISSGKEMAGKPYI